MSLPTLFEKEARNLSNLREASVWASQYLNRKVTVANLSYLIQYGKITKHSNNGSLFLDLNELKQYYDALEKEQIWKNTLGEDLNWRLSFVEYKEAERTKHVHRLHPYKGKFIPQLVEYFLDSHTDEFKREVYFQPNDIVLDPFCGSGTTLVQANELGLHAIGIDISAFNVLITNIKCEKHDIPSVLDAIQMLTCKLEAFQNASSNAAFESHLLTELSKFNSKYFPSPEYRRSVSKGEIDELKYAAEKEKEFLEIYFNLVNKYKLKIKQDNYETFINGCSLYLAFLGGRTFSPPYESLFF